jgi:Myb/SANT-like DNA-binding domain
MTPEELYAIYEDEYAEHLCGVNPWDEISEEERELWRRIAARVEAVSEAQRKNAGLKEQYESLMLMPGMKNLTAAIARAELAESQLSAALAASQAVVRTYEAGGGDALEDALEVLSAALNRAKPVL